jgi:hypothetical protein
MPLASIVEWEVLADLVVAAFAAGIITTLVYSFVILGVGRSMELRRDGKVAAATVYAVIAAIGFIAFAGLITVGIAIMVDKG